MCPEQFFSYPGPQGYENYWRKQVYLDGQSTMIEVYDIAGHEKAAVDQGQYIQQAECFLLVYDTTSHHSFDQLGKSLNQIERAKGPTFFQSYPGPLICIVGNKYDLVTERQVSTQKGQDLAALIGCEFLECSAKTSHNIEEAFLELPRQQRRQGFQRARENAPGSPCYTISRFWWRKTIWVPPSERNTVAGRERLTCSFVEAAKNNREKELLAFLKAGADINGQPGKDGAAIHAAAASGHLRIVKILLQKGRDRHRYDEGANSQGGPHGNALQAAASIGNLAIVKTLLNAGASINARGAGDCTALQVAAFEGHTDVIRCLLKYGVSDVDAPGGRYGTALQAAERMGRYEAVRMLMKAGAMKNAKSASPCPSIDESVGTDELVSLSDVQSSSNALSKLPTPPPELLAEYGIVARNGRSLTLDL
jgi:small GTP-binding protein